MNGNIIKNHWISYTLSFSEWLDMFFLLLGLQIVNIYIHTLSLYHYINQSISQSINQSIYLSIYLICWYHISYTLYKSIISINKSIPKVYQIIPQAPYISRSQPFMAKVCPEFDASRWTSLGRCGKAALKRGWNMRNIGKRLGKPCENGDSMENLRKNSDIFLFFKDFLMGQMEIFYGILCGFYIWKAWNRLRTGTSPFFTNSAN